MAQKTIVSRIIALIRYMELGFGVLAGLLLFAMMILGAADVALRYLFNAPITGGREFSLLFMGGMIFFSWAYALENGSHVSVDILFALYPPKVRAVLSLITLAVTLILFACILWQSSLSAMLDWQTGRMVNVILIPVYPFKFMVPVGAFLMCLECMVQMIQVFPEIFKRKDSEKCTP